MTKATRRKMKNKSLNAISFIPYFSLPLLCRCYPNSIFFLFFAARFLLRVFFCVFHFINIQLRSWWFEEKKLKSHWKRLAWKNIDEHWFNRFSNNEQVQLNSSYFHTNFEASNTHHLYRNITHAFVSLIRRKYFLSNWN